MLSAHEKRDVGNRPEIVFILDPQQLTNGAIDITGVRYFELSPLENRGLTRAKSTILFFELSLNV
jgi:hypothetical protein